MRMENQFSPSLPPCGLSASPVSTLAWCPPPCAVLGPEFVSLQSSLTPPRHLGAPLGPQIRPVQARKVGGMGKKKRILLPPAVNARPPTSWTSCLSLHLGPALPNTSKILNPWPKYNNRGPCWACLHSGESLRGARGMLWGRTPILLQGRATHTMSLWLRFAVQSLPSLHPALPPSASRDLLVEIYGALQRARTAERYTAS